MDDQTVKSGQVWLRAERPRKDRVTRERIVENAVALLDEQGAERVTMRRLAERMDTGSTTLYGHVETKDDVLDLALDAVFGEVPLPATPGTDWTSDVVTLMGNWREALLRHQWSAALLGRPMLGPNMLACEEFLHQVLVQAGFTNPELGEAAYALANYVIGSTLTHVSWLSQPTGTRQVADEHVYAHRDRFPALAAHRQMENTDWDASFDYGLKCLIDGLQAQLTQSTNPK